jgi:small subunit ribosomal protein S4
MSRYLGPKLRITRRIGNLPGLTKKTTKRAYPPGQHGPSKLNKKASNSEFSIRLQEKQKLRMNYGVSEKQLSTYVKKARRTPGVTGTLILQLLEMRLDNLVYRLGLASTIPSARQLVNHGHILVNGKNLDIPSFHCKPNDIISVKPRSIAFVKEQSVCDLINLPNHLEFDKEKLVSKIKSVVSREDVNLEVNELFIVEYYSRT